MYCIRALLMCTTYVYCIRVLHTCTFYEIVKKKEKLMKVGNVRVRTVEKSFSYYYDAEFNAEANRIVL